MNKKETCPKCFDRQEQLSSSLIEIIEDTRFKNLVEKETYQDKITGLEINIFECSSCQREYYLCKSKEQFSEFDENQKELFNNWFDFDNSLSEKASCDLEPFGIDRVTYLCKIRLISGEEYDFCRVTLYKDYPFFHIIPKRKNIIFLHEINDLSLSEYAFKPEVRRFINSSFDKEASRLDLGTAYLKTEDTCYYKIRGISAPDFFINNSLKGCDFCIVTEEELNKAITSNSYIESDNFSTINIYGQLI